MGSTIISEATLSSMPAGWWPTNGGLYFDTYTDYTLDYEQMYRRHNNVKICVDFLARNMAHPGLHVYKRNANDDRERVRDHPAVRILKRPLPNDNKITQYKMLEAAFSDMFVSGNGYLLKIRDGDGKIKGLLRIPYMLVNVEGVLKPTLYRVNISNGELQVEPGDVIHFRTYNPHNNTYGISPLEGLREILAEEHENTKYSAKFWKNAARINGVIERPAEAKDWSDVARANFRAQWESLYSGQDNAGKTAVLEEGMQFKPVTWAPKDTLYIESRKLTREECARAYHIPPPMVGILDRATFCLPAGELVYTEHGPKAIETIKVGERVYSLNKGGFELKKVIASQETGNDPILEIRTQNRVIRANAKHPILTRRKIYVEGKPDPEATGKVKSGQSRFHVEYVHEFVPAGELKTGDIIVAVNGDIEEGKRRFSNERMEFYGLFLGNGWVDVKRGHITIARDNDARYMDHYRGVIEREFRNFGTNGNGSSREIDTQPAVPYEGDRYTRFTSIVAAEEMVDLGFSGTAHTKRIPGWVFQTTREERLALLRGIIEADGSVNKKGQIDFGLCNKALVEDVRHLCFGLGIAVNNVCARDIKTKLPNGEWFEGKFYTICLSNPVHNREIGSHDPADLERLENSKPWVKGKTYRLGCKADPVPPQSCEYSRIVSITLQYPEPVYDLEVEDTHNFIASGVVVHNSNIESQNRSLYTDVLGPLFRSVQDDFDAQYLTEFPDLQDAYTEFNIEAKLQGDFEKQTNSFRQAVGVPYMTANEARARMNLPRIESEEADQLVTPLNMSMPATYLEPNDGKSRDQGSGNREQEEIEIKRLNFPTVKPDFPEITEQAIGDWSKLLNKTFTRQRDAVLPLVKGIKAAALWWDQERWDREVSADFYALSMTTAGAYARAFAGQLAYSYDPLWMEAYLRTNAKIAAENLNQSTFDQLAAAINEGEPVDAVKRVFEVLLTTGLLRFVNERVHALEQFAEYDVADKSGIIKTKTWVVRSGNPRDTHAALNGVTVGIRETFPNGAMWPGDRRAGPKETSYCQCGLVYGREKE